MRADILVPGRDVAAGAREQGTGIEGADVARQHQLLLGGPALGPHEPHGRNGLRVGPGGDLLPALGAIHDAGDREADRADRQNAEDNTIR